MKSSIKCIALAAALLLIVAGCEYDGPTAMYFQDQPDYPNASITGMNPEVATAGANYITVLGENFSDVPAENQVFFDNAQVDIIETSPTALTVRRPAKTGNAITVKVVTYGTLVVATYPSYQIDPVVEFYGNFVENKQHETISVDKDENVYIIQRSPATVHKITPDGKREVIGQASVIPTQAVIAPDGNLVYFKDKRIRRINTATGVADTLAEVAKTVTFGDYDENGNLYVSGKRADVIVVAPDLSSKATNTYAADEIFWIRIHDGYVYVLAELAKPGANEPALGIFRNPIQDATGTLGPREVVLDWTTTGEYAAAEPTAFTFAADGKILVAVLDKDNPFIIFNPQDGTQDIFYKGILTGNVAGMEWGNGDNLYYIKDTYTPEAGSDADGVNDCYRVDMGAPGAPYYGRM